MPPRVPMPPSPRSARWSSRASPTRSVSWRLTEPPPQPPRGSRQAVDRSVVVRDADEVALGIGKQAELRARNALGGEDDPAAELLGTRECRGDVVHVNEEGDMSSSALGTTDSARNRALDPGLDELVPGLGCLREGPVEQLAVEVASCIRVRGANFEVDDGIAHGSPLHARRILLVAQQPDDPAPL